MINDRQFFITKGKASAFEDWKEIALLNGYSLHYHEGLNIVYQEGTIILLGYAWQVDPSRKSPQEELSALRQKTVITHNDVYNIEKSWCGRYLLIVGEWIYLDTCGTLGVFFSEHIITSSLNVLCTLECREVQYPNIVHRMQPDFFPGMRTPYSDVFRLLPSQQLNYTTKEIKTRPLLIDKAPKYCSEEDLIKTFTRYFVNSAQNFSNTFLKHKIWLATTGGRDSRTTLACFEKARIEYNTFTLWHSQISTPDQILPKKLAKVLHRKHRFIPRNKNDYSQKRHKDYKTHTAGMAVDEDWNFYAYKQYQALQDDKKDIVIVRSGIFEISSFFYKTHSSGDPNSLTKLFPDICNNDTFYKSIVEWKDYVANDDVNSFLSFLDRTYWDLRGGCWLSSIEQSFDMMDGIISIQIANCRLFLSLLFGFDDEDRIKKTHEEKIVKALCSFLDNIPYDDQYKTQKQKIGHYLHVAKQLLKKLLGSNI